MKRIYSSPDRLMVGHLRNVLEGAGIRCLVRNEMLSAGLGEIPPIEAWPELWVVEDGDFPRAREVLAEALAPADPSAPPWTCPRCGEEVEAQFTECWRCGRGRLSVAE